MDQTAQHVPSLDSRHSGRLGDRRRSVTCGHGQTQSPMGSLITVVGDVRPEHPLEVPTPVDQDVVEALPARGPHEPLREGIRPRLTR